MAKRRGTKILTKKHYARVEREQRQRRIILIGSISVLIIVVGLIVYGIVEQFIIVPNQPVAVIGEDNITTNDFHNRVKFERRQLVQQYLSTYQNMQLFGEDENTQSFFQQTLNQIQFQLDPETLGQEVLNTMVEDTLVRQEAERLDIVVTEDEIDLFLQEAFGYYAEGGPPKSTPSPTTPPTSTLSPTQLALVPPTSIPSPPPTLTGTSSLPLEDSALSTLAASEDDALEPTSSPPPAPTATAFTLEAFQELYQGVLTSFDEDINLNEKEIRAILSNELYRQKVRESLLKDFVCEQDQVWARHILVADETIAQDVLGRIESGEDFVDLAAEYSTDESNKDRGGDLGWFGTGRMVPDFEKAAFDLEIGAISSPVESEFGWHIIQVIGHEVKPFSAFECDQSKVTEFSTWIENQWLITTTEIFDYWRERVPTAPSIPPDLR